MDILISQLKNLILPVAVVLTSGENKMLAFTLLAPFLIDFIIFLLKKIYEYGFQCKETDENTFCISSKTTNEEDNKLYYFVMEKIKTKCIVDKYFKGLNDRCIYEIQYRTEYNRKTNGEKIKQFTKYMKLNIPKKIEMCIYPSLRIGLSSTVKQEKFRFSKEPTEMDVINFYHKDGVTLDRFERMLIDEYKTVVRKKIEKKNSDKVKCYKYSSSSERKKWKTVSLNVNKTFKNTILSLDISNGIRNIIKKFDNSEKEYDRTGQPYKLGFLFHGFPGTGKTSFVFAISNEFKKNIYYANEELIYDDFPISVMESIKPGSLFVFEDVDLLIENFMTKRNLNKDNVEEKKKNGKVVLNRNGKVIKSDVEEKKKNGKVVLNLNGNLNKDDVEEKKKNGDVVLNLNGKVIKSDVEEEKKKNGDVVEGLFSSIIEGHKNKLLRKFLSIMDGYFSLKGVIVIFTTNDPTGFDDALLRSGRIGNFFKFDYCTEDQAKRIYKLFGKNFNLKSFNRKKKITSADIIKEMLK